MLTNRMQTPCNHLGHYGNRLVRLTKDKKIWVPDGDDCHLYGANYERQGFNLAMGWVPVKQVAVDAGAHVGIWSKRLANMFDHVVCFEPVSRQIECHRANCQSANIILHEVALGATNEILPMKVTIGSNTGRSTFTTTRFNPERHEMWDIQVKPLDDFNITRIDFMKIDVERHEDELMKGALKTIERCRPVIYMEVFKPEKSHAINLLKDLGYEKKVVFAENWILAPAEVNNNSRNLWE